jgi:hypothetical protein
MTTVDTTAVTDEAMTALLGTAATYTVCVLSWGPQRDRDGWQSIVWEHGRRNIAMRAAGRLAVTLRVDDPEVAGIGVYACEAQEVDRLLAGDPAVRAGVLTYRLHTADGFPGDALPERAGG